MKHFILCADDYGKNLSLSQAIIELLEKKRLTAVSCMVNTPHWKTLGPLLRPFFDQADIGLHFNLTEGKALSGQMSCMSLPVCLVKSTLRLINPQKIRDEINAQLNEFMSVFGKPPRYIDGHQHVHQFPVIQDALLAVYQARFPKKDVYVRSVYQSAPYQAFLKGKVIEWAGGATFRKKLSRLNIPHNESFSGIYNFKLAKNYSDIFPYFLKNTAENGIIMCHPGKIDQSDVGDPIAQARFYEYQYFQSQAFLEDCAGLGVELARFSF